MAENLDKGFGDKGIRLRRLIIEIVENDLYIFIPSTLVGFELSFE